MSLSDARSCAGVAAAAGLTASAAAGAGTHLAAGPGAGLLVAVVTAAVTVGGTLAALRVKVTSPDE